jgi:hypothetical protein
MTEPEERTQAEVPSDQRRGTGERTALLRVALREQ